MRRKWRQVLLGLEYVRREMAAWQPAEATPV
jgi:hypothetical protein